MALYVWRWLWFKKSSKKKQKGLLKTNGMREFYGEPSQPLRGSEVPLWHITAGPGERNKRLSPFWLRIKTRRKGAAYSCVRQGNCDAERMKTKSHIQHFSESSRSLEETVRLVQTPRARGEKRASAELSRLWHIQNEFHYVEYWHVNEGQVCWGFAAYISDSELKRCWRLCKRFNLLIVCCDHAPQHFQSFKMSCQLVSLNLNITNG